MVLAPCIASILKRIKLSSDNFWVLTINALSNTNNVYLFQANGAPFDIVKGDEFVASHDAIEKVIKDLQSRRAVMPERKKGILTKGGFFVKCFFKLVVFDPPRFLGVAFYLPVINVIYWWPLTDNCDGILMTLPLYFRFEQIIPVFQWLGNFSRNPCIESSVWCQVH